MAQSFLDPVLNPLLGLSPLIIVAVMSFVITVLITIIYKFTTKQDLMKQLKEEMKELQKEMRGLRNDPTKMMEVQQKSMATNMKYMSHSFRATFFTLVPAILFFGWMNAHLDFVPIQPGAEFLVASIPQEGAVGLIVMEAPAGISLLSKKNLTLESDTLEWKLKGKEGSYNLSFVVENKEGNTTQKRSYQHPIIISRGQRYADPISKIDDPVLKQTEIKYGRSKLLNLFGWKIGWLGTYIIFSIIFSSILRKLFKVY